MEWLIFLFLALLVIILLVVLVMTKKRTKQAVQQAQEQAQARIVDPTRMQLVHGDGTNTAIYRDAQTGVQYLMVARGWHGVAVTSMLDSDGKPLKG